MIRRATLAVLLVLCCVAAQATSLMFIATGNVPAGKFRMLDELAGPHGLRVQVLYLDKIPADADSSLFTGHDAIFIDSYQQHKVRARLAKALGDTSLPQVWLYDKSPAGAGLSPALAKRLASYYSNGGRENFDHFLATVAAWLAGRPYDGIDDPIVFPDTAVYHPDAPGKFYSDPLDYLRWKGIDAAAAADPAHRPPVIGIAFHQQHVASMQSAIIDDLIRRIEAAGAIPLAYYHSYTDGGANASMLRPQGIKVADAVINTRIMINPQLLRDEFETLGLPVVQATGYRDGDANDWRADPHGMPLREVPFYMTQAEMAGVIDIVLASAMDRAAQQLLPITRQTEAVVGKALRLVALQRKAPADKRLAVWFWNYPPGEKNLSASFLNAPTSMVSMLAALRAAGYDTQVPTEAGLLGQLQRLLEPYYREGRLRALLDDGLAVRFAVDDYRAWLATLPASVRDELQERWGDPESSSMVMREDDRAYFVIPRLALGKVTILPQPPRGERLDEREKAIYHSTKALPTHFYLAAYLWARTVGAADAFVHFGTHGSQEWMPGKERGLSMDTDYPMLALGDVPVVYPYIADNIGEAQQARRRGRAVIISHQTPPFRAAGLHDTLTAMHDLLHQWLSQDEGAVREQIKADLLAHAAREGIDLDMGWDARRAAQDFPAFIEALHAHLHELAQTAQPLGLHTLGQAPDTSHRLATVLLMLGEPFWQAASTHAGIPQNQRDEVLAVDYEQLEQSAPFALLRRTLVDDTDSANNANNADMPADLARMLDQARGWYADIGAREELPSLLRALAGGYVPTSYGGDPIKNPEAYPTGRNLYGFDPSRVPTPQAWEAGKQAAEQLLQSHQEQSGSMPRKLAFSLWSVETMRHQGLLEAQALWLLGVEPEWDRGGSVTGVKLIDRATLGRPRVDVVLSATGLYRDLFPNAMKQLAHAVQLAAEADEPDNPVFANTRGIQQALGERGVPAAQALAAAQTRIFSSGSGEYSTGLDDATLATDTWDGKEEGNARLAALYLSKMQFAYGPDESTWGTAGTAGAANLNLYAEHLRGTEGAVLSRTSNTYGMLTTDDPFQYLGGIGLAVQSLDGRPPRLYISNLRGGGAGRIENAASFLAKELATRQFHPGYIKGLMDEGYAGTLSVLDAVNNFWGWTAVARDVVRDDQWEQMADVYVNDKYNLGLQEWFERENPHALAQTLERMIEAARKGYWAARPETLDTLTERYRDLAQRFDVRSDNTAFLQYVAAGEAADSDFAPPTAQAEPEPEPAPPALPDQAQTEQVQGQQLEKIESAARAGDPEYLVLAALLLLLAVFATGAARQTRQPMLSLSQT